MNIFYKIISKIIFKLEKKIHPHLLNYRDVQFRKSFKYIHDTVKIYEYVHIVPSSNVHLCEGVVIAPFVQIWATGGLVIGKNTIIASHVIITTSTHDYTVTPVRSKRIDKPVLIGEDVWIGSGAIIFPGITIGNGAVIGAGAVVLNDVLDYEIVVGNPAKVLKKRVLNG